MSRSNLVKRRRNLMAEHPYCYWCGCKLIWYHIPGGFAGLESGRLPDNFATLDHINTKHDGPRPAIGKIVLSCWLCNHDRGIADEAIRKIRQDLADKGIS